MTFLEGVLEANMSENLPCKVFCEHVLNKRLIAMDFISQIAFSFAIFYVCLDVFFTGNLEEEE